MKQTITAGVLLAALAAFLGGCAAPAGQSGAGSGSAISGPTATPGPASDESPGELLARSIDKLNGKDIKYKVIDGKDAMDGEYDAASNIVTMRGDLDGEKISVITKGNDIYIGEVLPGEWIHAQASKFKGDGVTFLVTADPLFGLKFLSTAANVKHDRENTYSGTIDLKKVSAAGAAKKLAVSFAKSAGGKATALPFTITLDDSGNLSTLKMTFPKGDLGGGDLKYDLRITGTGDVDKVALPSKSKTIEAPAELYAGP